MFLRFEYMMTRDRIREELDGVDKIIFKAFEQRLALSREMAKWKLASGDETCDPARESEMIEARVAEFYSIDPDEVKGLQRYLIEAGKRTQEDLRRRYNDWTGSVLLPQ